MPSVSRIGAPPSAARPRRAGRSALQAAVSFCLVVLCLPILAQPPAPSDRDRAAAAARRTEERLRGLQREADALAAQERTVLIDLRKLEIDRQISVEQLQRIERDRAA